MGHRTPALIRDPVFIWHPTFNRSFTVYVTLKYHEKHLDNNDIKKWLDLQQLQNMMFTTD